MTDWTSPLSSIVAAVKAAGGAGLSVQDAAAPGAERKPGVIRMGVDYAAAAPGGRFADFDILLSAAPCAPRPWVGVAPDRLDRVLASLGDNVARRPAASAVAAQVLRAGEHVLFGDALMLESIAYSMLLASYEFAEWRAAHPARSRKDGDDARISSANRDGALVIELNRPLARNAFDARMRDALVEALEAARDDPGRAPVVLCGAGPAFSAGGDLAEFGVASDPGIAHLIRTLRSPARLVHELGDRITARVHGACIGAGIEIPAAAARVIAAPDTEIRLPEVSMGLIPGAGGSVTIPHRIGRQRALYLMLSGCKLGATQALQWGLVDAIEDRAC